jgi:hypothetical protein
LISATIAAAACSVVRVGCFISRYLLGLVFIEETLPDRGAARSSCLAVRADNLMSLRWSSGKLAPRSMACEP